MIEWYVRQNGQSRGPLTSAQVRRLLLEEQLTPADLVSSDGLDWRTIAAVPEVLPRQLRGIDAEDERDRLAEGRSQRRQALGSALVLLGLVGGLLGLVLWLDKPAGSAADCTAPAGPGVDWQDCHLRSLHAARADLRAALLTNAAVPAAQLHAADLSGADLRYTDLRDADLSYARLAGASLKGADLRGADLTYADLDGADLSFADLRGASIGGADLRHARLHGALWIDGRRCGDTGEGDCGALR
jgi:hypothetical protein